MTTTSKATAKAYELRDEALALIAAGDVRSERMNKIIGKLSAMTRRGPAMFTAYACIDEINTPR